MDRRMGQKLLPEQIDTVIVGNGPSALILSYILNGNIPYYNASYPHPDPILHQKLVQLPALLNTDVADLTAHFAASRLSYSTQALPINVLLDTLIRPLADTHPGEYQTCVEWRHEPGKRVPHVVLGNTGQAGGQWADNPVSASWGIGTLSYAEMLSLPGYLFEDYYQMINKRQPPEFYRPTRREVAGYLAIYPEMVNISNSIFMNTEVSNVRRINDGFCIASPGIRCKNLVLASGIFTNLIPPRPLLRPLATLVSSSPANPSPLLIIGSGFSAADVIISTPPGRKILHIFKWDPDGHPSPLKACHPCAYPEYASVYRQMKLAARKANNIHEVGTPLRLKKCNSFFAQRDWDNTYEGFPNTYIKEVNMRGDVPTLTLVGPDGLVSKRGISSMEYVVGRRGSLKYLERPIRNEVLAADGQDTDQIMISGRTLRSKVEESLEVAPGLLIIGSLAGDSLIRFAFGSCIVAARTILNHHGVENGKLGKEAFTTTKTQENALGHLLNGDVLAHEKLEYLTNGHSNLGIDKRERAMSIELEVKKCQLWSETGLWTDGCTVRFSSRP